MYNLQTEVLHREQVKGHACIGGIIVVKNV